MPLNPSFPPLEGLQGEEKEGWDWDLEQAAQVLVRLVEALACWAVLVALLLVVVKAEAFLLVKVPGVLSVPDALEVRLGVKVQALFLLDFEKNLERTLLADQIPHHALHIERCVRDTHHLSSEPFLLFRYTP